METNSQPVNIGDIILFGSYNWRVLDIKNNKALILTEDIIEESKYHDEYEDVTWETCTLRKFLNDEFLQRFTSEQQKTIEETQVKNNDNLWYGIKGGNDTTDKIFLLSLEEADQYFGNNGDYINKRRKDYKDDKFITTSDGYWFSNKHDSERSAKLDDNICWWWLRSPGDYCNRASDVGCDGRVLVCGYSVDSFDGGVRPALWLKLK